MSFLPFPKIQAVNVFESNETKTIAGVTFSENLELKNIRVALYFNGSFVGEKLTLEIHGNQFYDSKIADSTEITLTADQSNWVGLIRFDFSNVPVNLSKQYWLKLKSASYTRNLDVKYFGSVQDYPYPVACTGSIGPFNPAKVLCYGIRR